VYDRRMPLRRVILLVLALPAAVLGYLVAGSLLAILPLPDDVRTIVLLFVPLLAAGLCATPFIAPAFDHLATRALAERPPPDADRGAPRDRRRR